jgi:hypothetical protein
MADYNSPQIKSIGRLLGLVIGRVLHYALALSLVATFLLQSHLLIELLSRGYLQVPSVLLERLNDRVQFRGASLAAKSIVYHTGGRISVKGLRLGDMATGARLASVHELTLEGLNRNAHGNRGGIRLHIYKARLYRGDIDGSALLHAIEGRLSLLESGWVLDSLLARHEMMTLTASGSLPHAPKVKPLKRVQERVVGERRPPPERVPDLASSLQAIVAVLDASLQHLPQAEQTHLHLALSAEPNAPSQLIAAAHLHSGRLVTHFGSLGPLFANGELRFDLRDRHWQLQAHGSLDSLRSPQFAVRAEDLQFSLESVSKGQPHSRLNIASGPVSYRLESIDRAVLWASLESLQAIHCDLVITLDRTTQLAANARVNLMRAEADLELNGTVDPILLVEHPLLQPLTPRMPFIEIMDRPYLNAKVRFAKGFQFQSASLRARIEPLRLDDITIDYADAILTTDGVAFTVERALLETGKHHGYVSAHYHSQSGDYAVHLEGIFDPNSINSIVGSWWESIFSPFDFSEIGASWADFVIRGNHADRRPRYFNGNVDAQSVGFEGLRIDSGHLKVRGTPTFVELFDLYALHESGGTISGSIFWLIVPGSNTGPEIYHLLLDAEMDPAVIVPALPPEAARWAAAFNVQKAPKVHLEVRQHNPDFNPPADANSVFIQAASNGAVSFEGIPLDELSFDFYGKGNRSYLRGTRFHLADGIGSLNVDRWLDADDTAQLRFQFELENALRGQALEIVREYLERNQNEATEVATPLPTTADKKTGYGDILTEKQDPARISVRLNAEGPEDNPMDFVGPGHFRLKDPNLASIPLLGPISRLFESTPLGFTSLRLNTMHGDFRLRREQVFFPQLMIVGSVGEMEAIGTYSIPDKAIDFRLYIRLFGQLIETPGFIRRITRNINPFPGILEGNLSGTLDEPRWRSAYDPRSWLPFVPSGD